MGAKTRLIKTDTLYLLAGRFSSAGRKQEIQGSKAVRRHISSRRNSVASTARAEAIEEPKFIFADRLRAMSGRDAGDARIIYLSKHARGKGTNWALWLTVVGSLVFFAASLAGVYALAGLVMRTAS